MDSACRDDPGHHLTVSRWEAFPLAHKRHVQGSGIVWCWAGVAQAFRVPMAAHQVVEIPSVEVMYWKSRKLKSMQPEVP